jgi:2-polyprenyl-3-methyl-5-hydroxy-6-metoxy-1,4-benzoquinol methylase
MALSLTMLDEAAPQIAATPQLACPFCRRVGEILYTGMVDWLNGVPQSWGTRRCVSCGLAWLDPQPRAEDVPKLYASYYTHHANPPTSYIGRLQQETSASVLARLGYPVAASPKLIPRLLSRLPFAKRLALLSVLGLPPSSVGSLLDIGCGNGEFIARMSSFGWTVSGVDLDSSAVSYAQSQGLNVRVGTIADVEEHARYDVIVLTHVIEHVSDPVELLRECRKRLNPDKGQVIIVTPNINSLGHAWFKRYWRGLEIPRHFVLFSPEALRECAARAGLVVRSTSTETRLAPMLYKQSACARAGERGVAERTEFKIGTKLAARIFRWIEEFGVRLKGDLGEEIFCVCAKSSE